MCRDRINCYKIPHSPARCVLDSNLLSQNINTKQTHTHARKKVRKTFTYIYLDTIPLYGGSGGGDGVRALYKWYSQ